MIVSISNDRLFLFTALLSEGQTIERIGFIQQGKCLAYARVPHTPKPTRVSIIFLILFCNYLALALSSICAYKPNLPCYKLCAQEVFFQYTVSLHFSWLVQVCIGELGPGSCVGELLLQGRDYQPYSVISATRVRIGWVSSTTVRGVFTISIIM